MKTWNNNNGILPPAMIQFLIGINSNVYVRFLCLIFTQPLLIQRAITSGQIRYNQMALVLALRSFK